MSPIYEQSTDQLVQIIQKIQLARGTGSLRVRRSSRSQHDEGHIVFVNGQVIEAKVARRKDTEALNWMCTWGLCIYSFISSDAIPGLLVDQLPTPDERMTGPIRQTPSPPVERTTGPIQQTPSPPGERTTGPMQQTPLPLSKEPISEEVNTGNIKMPSPGSSAHYPLALKPQDVAFREIAQQGLSRTHRQFFLLVNGQRSLEDLARLTNRKLEEVETLLRDLARIHLIYLPD